MLLTEKISLKSEPLCYSRDFIAELREKIYDLLFIRELGIIRARVWISALLWVVYFKGSSWTIISTGFWERIMLCSVIRKQHHRSIRFHLKFFHVFSKSRLPAKKALLYFFHQKSYHFYCYWRKLSPLDRKMIKLLTFDNLFPPLRHVVWRRVSRFPPKWRWFACAQCAHLFPGLFSSSPEAEVHETSSAVLYSGDSLHTVSKTKREWAHSLL